MADQVFTVIEENHSFVVVNKAAGVGFHCEGEELGLFEQVKQALSLTSLYPVHRLDKVTSGLVVFAKTAEANQQLCEAFKNKSVEKYYLAISQNKPSKKQGLIIGDMQPARRGSFKLLKTCNNPAVTQFFSESLGDGKRLFLLKPHTGKTHQLRVALKSLGAAILGDPLYSDGSLDGDRTYLHAFHLAFSLNNQNYRFQVLPDKGIEFTSDVFNSAMQKFLSPHLLSWPAVKSCKGKAS